MKTKTYAQVALLIGPFTDADCVEVPARGEEGLKFLKEQYGDSLIAFVYFDVKETQFQGLTFTSEPHNQERVDVISEETVKKRMIADSKELSDALNEAITALSDEAEKTQKVKKAQHTLH